MIEPTDPMTLDDLNEIAGRTIRGIRQLQTHIEAMLPYADEARTWLVSDDNDFGGIYCQQPGCGCEAENSQIMGTSFDCTTFNLNGLHAAIRDHIALRAQIKAEERDPHERD